MALDPFAARVFLPFVAIIGLYVAWSDLRGMRIPNASVILLALVFVVLGPFLFPIEIYGPRLLHLLVMLLVGFTANAVRLMGAGDAKFIAAAAPFVALGDVGALVPLFAANLLAAYVTHRVVKRTPLRRLAPNWESWDRTRDFPMGTALSTTLTIYLILAALG